MVSKYHYYRLSVFVCSLHLQPPHFNFFTYLRVWSWLLKFNLPSSSLFYGDIIGSTVGSPTDGVGRKPLFEDGCRHLKYRRNVSVDICLYHVNKCLSEKKREHQSFCMTKCENWCLQLNEGQSRRKPYVTFGAKSCSDFCIKTAQNHVVLVSTTRSCSFLGSKTLGTAKISP